MTYSQNDEKHPARRDMVASPRLGSSEQGLATVVFGGKLEGFVFRFVDLNYQPEAAE